MSATRSRVLHTVVRDCLYLNWAFALESLPRLPAGLEYERHRHSGQGFAFGSALLFRHERLHFAGLPFFKISYPQFNFRFCVIDQEKVPSVFFHSIMVPRWLAPTVRWLGSQPAVGGSFTYPNPLDRAGEDDWKWSVERHGRLWLSARPGTPRLGSGPPLGSWEQATSYFRMRRRGYLMGPRGLRIIETAQHPVPVWPVEVSIHELEMLTSCLDWQTDSWPDLHSAWICPEIPFVFELSDAATRKALARSAASVAPDPAMFGTTLPQSRRSAA